MVSGAALVIAMKGGGAGEQYAGGFGEYSLASPGVLIKGNVPKPPCLQVDQIEESRPGDVQAGLGLGGLPVLPRAPIELMEICTMTHSPGLQVSRPGSSQVQMVAD